MLYMQDFLNWRDLHLLPTKRPGSGCSLITWLIFCTARLHLNLPFTEHFFSVNRTHSCRRSNGYFAKEFRCSRALSFVLAIIRKKSFSKDVPSLKMLVIGCSRSDSISSNQPSKLNHAELFFFSWFLLFVLLPANISAENHCAGCPMSVWQTIIVLVSLTSMWYKIESFWKRKP